MSTGVATGADAGGGRTLQLVLIGLLVLALAFGAAFAIGSMSKEDSGGGSAQQATPIEPSTASPKLPSAPPAAALPELKPPPAPQGGGSPAPPSGTPAPAPAPAPGGGGGGGTIIEG